MTSIDRVLPARGSWCVTEKRRERRCVRAKGPAEMREVIARRLTTESSRVRIAPRLRCSGRRGRSRRSRSTQERSRHVLVLLCVDVAALLRCWRKCWKAPAKSARLSYDCPPLRCLIVHARHAPIRRARGDSRRDRTPIGRRRSPLMRHESWDASAKGLAIQIRLSRRRSASSVRAARRIVLAWEPARRAQCDSVSNRGDKTTVHLAILQFRNRLRAGRRRAKPVLTSSLRNPGQFDIASKAFNTFSSSLRRRANGPSQNLNVRGRTGQEISPARDSEACS